MMDSRILWRTLRAHGTEWRDQDLVSKAFLRRHPPGLNTVMIEGTSDRPPNPVERWSLWIELPDTIRTEFGVFGEQVTAVIRGASWWSVSSHDEPRTNEGNPNSRHGTGPGYPLTEPRRLVFGLELEPHEETTFADRPAVRVSATPMEGNDADRLERFAFDEAVMGFGTGADRYELLVDAEFGVVLRSEAMLEGAPFLVLAIQEVAFNETFPEETFTLEPPPGKTFTTRDPFGGRW